VTVGAFEGNVNDDSNSLHLPTLAANAGSNVSPELKKKRNDMKKQIKTKAQTLVRN